MAAPIVLSFCFSLFSHWELILIRYDFSVNRKNSVHVVGMIFSMKYVSNNVISQCRLEKLKENDNVMNIGRL